MDKNNDIQVNRVSKWEAAPDSIKDLHYAINGLFDRLSLIMDVEEGDNSIYTLSGLLAKVLDDYNELEAKYQEACGMISQYEEENRILREQKEELTDAHAELAEDNDNLERERDRYAYHLKGLCQTLNDNDIIADWSEAAIKWSLYKWDEVKGQWCSYDKATTCESCKKHYEEELRIREKEKDEKDKLIEELNSKITMLKLRTNMIYSCYGLNPLGELNEKIKVLEKENEELKAKNSKNNDIPYGYFNLISSLRAGIEALEKENKELKDTLAKDRELGKYVGKCVADSIQEGWKNGAYELHPYMRFDIHVAETKNTSTSFDRYSIPNVVVAFNNTQTEMERDTTQHECEELNEKIDRLWSVNDELNRKIKGLTKEKKRTQVDPCDM